MGADASKLQEKYHIQKVKLGEGSFGVVWRGVDRYTNEVVAIKCVEKDKMRKRGTVRRFWENNGKILTQVGDIGACRIGSENLHNLKSFLSQRMQTC